MLSDIPAQTDDRVLIDFRTADDAGVYKWEGGPALVQTVDFFTPIVDDPYVYGQIAAANAVSDIYAMGGRPLTALAIAAFPKEGLDPQTIRSIFREVAERSCSIAQDCIGQQFCLHSQVPFVFNQTHSSEFVHEVTDA